MRESSSVLLARGAQLDQPDPARSENRKQELVVAVFDIQDSEGKLSTAETDRITEYFIERLSPRKNPS